MRTLSKEELATLAANHKIACENVECLTLLLHARLSMRDKATVLHFLMVMRYAAARTDYLIQCHLLRVNPYHPPSFDQTTLQEASPMETDRVSCQCHLVPVNLDVSDPPCTHTLSPDIRSGVTHLGFRITRRCFEHICRFENLIQWDELDAKGPERDRLQRKLKIYRDRFGDRQPRIYG